MLPAHSVKRPAEKMDRVIAKLHIDLRSRIEDAFIDFANVGPPAPDAAQWMRHGRFLRVDPVAFHQREIARVERLIEFAKRTKRLSRIDLLLPSCHRNDGETNGRIHAVAPNAA